MAELTSKQNNNPVDLDVDLKNVDDLGDKGVEITDKQKQDNIDKKQEENQSAEILKNNEIKIDDLMNAGTHLGHITSKLHPRMGDFIIGTRGNVHIIDLEKTAEHLKIALEFLNKAKKENKKLMFVSTKIPLRSLVAKTAKEMGIPYVVERWIGGTFSNFDVIRKRVNYFCDLRDKKEKGELEKYTKKEKLKINDELEKLEIKFGGITEMKTLPDIIFFCDIIKDKLALKEAKAKGIKTVAIIDTNADPLAVDYPIPANDDSALSIKYILEKIKKAFS